MAASKIQFEDGEMITVDDLVAGKTLQCRHPSSAHSNKPNALRARQRIRERWGSKMKKPSMKFDSRQGFDRIVDEIQSELIYVELNYGIFLELDGQSAKSKREFRRTSAFWGMTRDSFLAVAVLGLCRVYDDHFVANSLRNFLITIQPYLCQPETAPSFLAELIPTEIDQEQLINDLAWSEKGNPSVHRLRQWRRHVLAHINFKNIAQGEKIPKSDIPKFEEMPILIDRGLEIVSRYGGSFMSRSLHDHFVPRKEMEFVFECVRERMNITEAAMRAYLEERNKNPDVFLDEDQLTKFFEKMNRL